MFGRWQRVVTTLVMCATGLASAANGRYARGQAPLESQLLAETPEVLAEAARAAGDAARGAIVFYQPMLTCRTCHHADAEGNRLGPDLTQWETPPSDVQLVNALLRPSQEIRKGYEGLTVVTEEGLVIAGLIVEDGDEIVLRDAATPGLLHRFERDALLDVAPSELSLMPAGLTGQLASRQQFLDLVRYLMALRDEGTAAERALEPAPHLYALPPLPEYEQSIDHAGMIAELGDEHYRRGEAIYQRVCLNCHGTHDAPGSLPTSLRFASGAFKNGSDPYAMYQTLTRGFGMMQPQTWMVPQQKYDVIHYIREAYLKAHNPSQHFAVDAAWLAALPPGDTRGPEPQLLEPWVAMDYGPVLLNTYEVGDHGGNFAHKGIAVRLDPGPGGVSRGRHWMLYDHDTLRMAAAWSTVPDATPFIDWRGIHFNGQHFAHPHLTGQLAAENRTGPGWASPAGAWDDARLVGRDGKHYGPLPRDWAQFTGLALDPAGAQLAYRVGTTEVVERPLLLAETPLPIFGRQLRVGPRSAPLTLQVAQVDAASVLAELPSGVVCGPADASGRAPERTEPLGDRLAPALPWLAVGVRGDVADVRWELVDGALRLTLPAGDAPCAATVWLASAATRDLAEAAGLAALEATELPYAADCWTAGRPAQRPDAVVVQPLVGSDEGPFAIDVLTSPDPNPWLAQVRLTGFDFFADGDTAAVCSWDGDVWRVTGVDALDGPLTWQRIATGLFQPLGLKIVDETIYVTCRDQLVRLRELNGDHEIDVYETFNNDHQVTEHFHEFAMGLQTDAEGNFYYAKSARHAMTPLVPHHGTLLRISADGQRTDVLATGFRAANGVCLNDDGTFFVTDQEGHWTPKNRINRVRIGGFYGNMWGYHDVVDTADEAMEEPLCWITNDFDRSPAELVWTPPGTWGPLEGALLNLSYGYGKVYVVPHERRGDRWQGGMCELPIPAFPTGVMRGRFHPHNGALYVCGMFAWAGNQTAPGGFYRIRATGRPMHLPIGWEVRPGELSLTFSDPLDRAAAEDPANWVLTAWDLRRTEHYGSDHVNQRGWEVKSAALAEDGRTVTLGVPDLAPTRGLEVRCYLKTADGRPLERKVHGTINWTAP